MATYVTLWNYTQQGMAKIKDSPSRLDAARAAWEDRGVTIKDFYLTLGQYDFVTVVEAPDDATAARVLLATTAQGNATGETLRAFTEDEYREIIAVSPLPIP
jgi:uncharacterized protein with GYD domain